jgi:hypothetical protein
VVQFLTTGAGAGPNPQGMSVPALIILPPGPLRYQPRVGASLRERRQLEHDVRQALARGEVSMVYQPQTDLKSGRIFGFEVPALIRSGPAKTATGTSARSSRTTGVPSSRQERRSRFNLLRPAVGPVFTTMPPGWPARPKT